MALRLFLVGVVASLALDLPNGGWKKTAESSRRWLDTQLAAASTGAKPAIVADVTPPPIPREASPASVAQAAPTLSPTTAVATIDAVPTTAPVAPTTPVATTEPTVTNPTAAKVTPIPAELESALTLDLAPTPSPMPMPMPPPAPEIADASTPASAAATAPEAITAAPVTDPMTPPPAEIAATPAPQVVPPAPEIAAETPKPADPDAAFTKVVNAMASSFAADSSPVPTVEPKPLLAESPLPPAPATAAEEVASPSEPTDAELYSGLAFELNRTIEGLAATPAVAEPIAQVEPAPPPLGEPTPEEESRSERLARAVKLTGQAVNAWASLLSQRPAVSTMQR